MFHEIDVITEEYHIWHGAIPIFRIMAITRIEDIKLMGIEDENHDDIEDISISLDPSACIRKYFTAASVSWKLFVDIINGINLNRFSSREIHKNNQFELERTIIVLITNEDEAKKLNGVIKIIKTWRSRTTKFKLEAFIYPVRFILINLKTLRFIREGDRWLRL